MLDGTRINLSLISNAKVNGVGNGLDVVTTPGSVDLTGAVYDYAVARHDTAIDFGVTRTTTVRNLAVANILQGSSALYQDSLGVSAARTNLNLSLVNPGLVLPLSSDNVVITAASAGFLDDTIGLTLTSSALVNDLTNVNLASGTVTVTGLAYDFAKPTVSPTRALGNVRVGATANLVVTNTTISNASFQDKLAVAATSSATGVITVADPAAPIAAGQSGNVVLTAMAPGLLTSTAALGFVSQALAGTGLDNLTSRART